MMAFESKYSFVLPCVHHRKEWQRAYMPCAAGHSGNCLPGPVSVALIVASLPAACTTWYFLVPECPYSGVGYHIPLLDNFRGQNSQVSLSRGSCAAPSCLSTIEPGTPSCLSNRQVYHKTWWRDSPSMEDGLLSICRGGKETVCGSCWPEATTGNG